PASPTSSRWSGGRCSPATVAARSAPTRTACSSCRSTRARATTGSSWDVPGRPSVRARAVVVVLGLAGLVLVDSLDVPVAPAGGPAARLDSLLRRSVPYGFSGVVLVARGDTVVLHQAYGRADRARNLALTTGSIFDIGSVTKLITRAAILDLEHAGKLALSDSL